MRYFFFLYILLVVIVYSFIFVKHGHILPEYIVEHVEKECKKQKSWLVSFLEKRLSLSGSIISISEIKISSDVLSSIISIPLITVSDKKGIWLKITDTIIQWNIINLLTEQLFSTSLQVERIDIIRRPEFQKENKILKASILKLPLPFAAFLINSVSFQKIVIGKYFFDNEIIFSLIGQATFIDDNFNSTLLLKRLDKKGSNSNIIVEYNQTNHHFNFDSKLTEPVDGIINTVLGIKNSYPINLSLKGNGQIENILLKLVSESGEPRIHGIFSLQKKDKGKNFFLSMEGISRFIPEKYHRITGKNSILTVQGRITENFNIEIKKFVFDVLKKQTSSGEIPIFPLHLFASGSYKNNVLHIDNLTAKLAEKFLGRLSGRIPFFGDELNIRIYSIIPLPLVNYFLESHNTRFTGQLAIDVYLRGSFSSLLTQGKISLSKGKIFNSHSNIQLTEISLLGHFDDEKLVLDQLTGKSAQGGSFSIHGDIVTNIKKGFPAQLTLRLNRLRYINETLFEALLGGNIEVTGPLLYKPLLTGTIAIKKIEISIANQKKQTDLLDVQHVNLSSVIAQTLIRIKLKRKYPNFTQFEDKKSLFAPVFNLHINAPKRIFIRGQGIDAELGGDVRLTGKLSDIHPVGGFYMIRGQFNILGRKLNFSKGTVTLTGNLNPDLNFVAETISHDFLVTLSINGTPDAILVYFTSKPDLPQDEILARLLFNRSLNELSAFQFALLLDAAAEITGITEKSFISNLRSGIGLDSFNIVTDHSGKIAIQAGRYVNDNVYVGVETGSVRRSSGTINFDVNENFKVKANMDTDVNSGIGLFFEKEY